MSTQGYLIQSKEILKAAELVRANARTSTVLRLVDIDPRTLMKLSTEIRQRDRAGKQGRTYQLIDWYLMSLNCLHASAFYNLFVQYSKYCDELYDTFTQSYNHYTRLHSKNDSDTYRLDIDRALHLIQQVRDRQLRQVSCTCCHGLFVTTYTAIDRFYECPVCSNALKRKRYDRGTRHHQKRTSIV